MQVSFCTGPRGFILLREISKIGCSLIAGKVSSSIFNILLLFTLSGDNEWLERAQIIHLRVLNSE